MGWRYGERREKQKKHERITMNHSRSPWGTEEHLSMKGGEQIKGWSGSQERRTG